MWAVDALGNPVPGAAFELVVLADDDADAASSAADADGGAARSEPPPPRRPATAHSTAHAERPASASAQRPTSASAAGRRTPQRVEVLEVTRRARPCACACITARFYGLTLPLTLTLPNYHPTSYPC